MNREKIVKWTAVAACVLALGGCVNRTAQKQAAATQKLVSDPTKPITVATVAKQNLSEQVEITGALTTSQDVMVGAKNPGRIVAVYVKDGDSVKRGQLIAVQDTSTQELNLQQALAAVGTARSNLTQAISSAKYGPAKSTAGIQSAEAQLRSAKAQYKKTVEGARPEERQQAEATVASAKSNMDTAKKDLDRKRDLFTQGGISRQQLDQSENAYQGALSQYQSALAALSMEKNWSRPEDIEAAKETVNAAEQALKTAQANKDLDVLLTDQVATAKSQVDVANAQVKVARQAIEDAQIKAPFDGKISGQPVQVGSVPGSGGAVAHLISNEGIYFQGDVPETLISKIHEGSAVSVTVDALPSQSFAAHIASISPSASSIGRLFSVRVVLDNASGDLKTGMFARGDVTLKNVPDAIVVPSVAILSGDGENYVFTSDGKKAHKVKVTVGLVQGDYTQVTGVKPGDQVVIKGQTDLVEGTPIKIDSPPSQQTALKGSTTSTGS